MKYRKLRIAWSVAWGLAAVLLAVLWVRSRWVWDEIDFQLTPQHRCILYSISGHVACNIYDSKRYSEHPKQRFRYVRGDIADLTEGYDPLEKVNRFGFGAIFQWQVVDVLAPSWFAVLLLVGVAATPWVRWSKSFSLRTLLVLATLSAVALGMALWLR